MNYESLGSGSQALNAKEAHPNMADFEGELAKEIPETPEGRNIIIGQSVLMLKRYQFETNSDSRDELESLDEAIIAARKAEYGVKTDDHGNVVGDGKFTEAEKVAAATECKTKLDGIRTRYTVEGKLIPPELAVVNINHSDTPLARNMLRQAALNYLKDTPQTEANKDSRTELRQALNLSTYAETGEIYNVPQEQYKTKFGNTGSMDFSITSNETPADKKHRQELNKYQASQVLKTALNKLTP